MTDFAENMAQLLKQLEEGKITPEQFEKLSAGLIDTVGEEKPAEPDPVRLEQIEATGKMLREL